MRRLQFATFLLLLLGINCAAQVNRVRLSVTNPSTGKEENLRVAALTTTSEVTGNRVITTYALTFANPFKRQLEGFLHFALGEGENVIRFALEINGRMREGVVVDKNKGQKVFEEIVRRRVDPGLIEKTEGNNYRARVFPIPAEGTKQLIIACEKVIPVPYKKAMPVLVPLTLGVKVDDFKLRLVVNNNGQDQPVLQSNEKIKARFEKQQQSWVAETAVKNLDLNTTLQYDIPAAPREQLFTQREKDGNGYFFSAVIFQPGLKPEKKEPGTIALVWDNSLSGLRRDKQKELELIGSYIRSLKRVQVNVYTCNTKMSAPKSFTISGGNSSALTSYLQGITYDGATQLGAIDLTTITADEVLLVTDGLSNYGEDEIRYGKTPVYAIVSAPSANYSYLDFITSVTGGKMINAGKGSDMQASLKALQQLPVSLLSYTSDAPVSDVYYDLNISPDYGFIITGRCSKPETTLRCTFGVPGNPYATENIKFTAANEITGSNAVERTWAMQKLNRLLLLPEKNKAAIISHSTTYSVVSPFTSLLVLDDINDYVQYEIEPPAELKAQYIVKRDSVMALQKKEKADRLNTVYNIYKKKKDWWEKDYYEDVAEIQLQERIAAETKKWEIKLAKKQAEVDSVKRLYARSLITIQERDRTIDSLKVVIAGIKMRSDSLKSPQLKKKKEYAETHQELKIEASKKMMERVEFTSARADARASAYNVTVRDANATMALSLGNLSEEVEDPNNPGTFIRANRALQGKEKKIELDEWKSDAPYIKAMEKIKDDSLYAAYLRMRPDYINMAPFYLDMGELFAKKGKSELANLIFSNVVELSHHDYAMMRVLAHRMLQAGETATAVNMFEKVVKLRPEEPQSYRDLGLALARNKNYQAAIDTLYNVITHDWNDRFPEIESIVLTELNNIIATCNEPLSLAKIDSRFLLNMTAAARVVVCWDTDNCDIDLWVTEPTKEKCFYSKPLSQIGGRLSRDFTRGYGPEEYMLHYPLDGNYLVELNYFGQSAASILGPTTIVVQIYTDYGKPTQQMREITKRISNAKEVIKIGDVTIGK